MNQNFLNISKETNDQYIVVTAKYDIDYRNSVFILIENNKLF